MNRKGFTLIELLAVITIMGILMIVAIPAVTRTIENSRKDTFIDMAKQYTNGVKNMWASDNFVCSVENIVSSGVRTGFYYIEVNSMSNDVPQVLESGGKSPWGNRDVAGYVVVRVEDVTNASGNVTRKVKYYPVLVDGIHGINTNVSALMSADQLKEADVVKRGDLVMSGAGYNKVTSSNTLSSSSTIDTPVFCVLDASGTCNINNLFQVVKCVET